MLSANEPAVFSSLISHCVDDCNRQATAVYKSSTSTEAQIFGINIEPGFDGQGRLARGNYYIVFDVGNNDLLRINATIRNHKEFMTLNEIEFHDSSDYFDVMKKTHKEILERKLMRAMEDSMNYDATLDGDEIAEVLRNVISRHPDVQAGMDSIKISSAINGNACIPKIKKNSI